MPYWLHGCPQWMSPPMNSYAVRWLCRSASPRTSPFAVVPVNGSPVTFSSASGAVAQPVAGTSVKRVAVARSARVCRIGSTASWRLADTAVIVTASPAAVSRQSVSAPAARADSTPSVPRPWPRKSLPVP